MNIKLKETFVSNYSLLLLVHKLPQHETIQYVFDINAFVPTFSCTVPVVPSFNTYTL